MPSVENRGASIHYEVHGDAGDPVVLVMGLGVDAHGWEFQLADFSRRHKTVVLDNRGVGRSSKPPGPYTTALMASDVAAVLDDAGVARAHVVGISMGGMIAQELALEFPSRVGSLTLLATYARPDAQIHATSTDGAARIARQGSGAIPGAVNGMAGGMKMLLQGGMDPALIDPRVVLDFLMPLVLSSEFRAAKRDWLASFWTRSLGYGFQMAGFLAQLGAVMAHDTTARLPSLRVPTLVVTGDADRLVPPRHSDELARLVPGAAQVTVKGGTHGFNFEMPETLNPLVLAFIEEHPL